MNRDPVVSGDAVTLRPAGPADLTWAFRLLERADLPTAGVAEHFGRFVVAEQEGRIVGVAGLEVHGDAGVLRSVAVAPALQGTGLGRRLTEAILASVRDSGLRRLYLLTTTADGYFPRFGFRRIDRGEASPEVQGSVEFSEACPASAVAMVLDLGRPGPAPGQAIGP